jgi:hypothetical protein
MPISLAATSRVAEGHHPLDRRKDVDELLSTLHTICTAYLDLGPASALSALSFSCERTAELFDHLRDRRQRYYTPPKR